MGLIPPEALRQTQAPSCFAADNLVTKKGVPRESLCSLSGFGLQVKS